ncbi:B1 bradykinin receptor [Aplochiton taeniatus]
MVLQRFENSSVVPFNATAVPDTTEWLLLYTIVPPYILTLTVVGLMGNLFVLLVLLLHKDRLSVPEIYLGNLALADLFLLACLPFWAVNILNHFTWPFGDAMCKIVNLSILTNFYTSMYVIAMISVDRYLALVKTMKARWLRRTRYAKATCLVLWLFGLSMGSLNVVHRKVMLIEDYQTVACILAYPHPSWKLAHQILMNAVGFVFPVLVIVFCSCNIIRTLHKRRESVYSVENNDRKATLLVYAVTLLFVLCWGPFQIFTFLDILCDAELLDDDVWFHHLDIGTQVSAYLAFLNSGVNPVLYVFSGQYFRRKVSAIYRRTKHRRRGSDMTTYQRSMVSTYINRTELIKPVGIAIQ